MTGVRQLEIVKVPKVHLCRNDGLVFSLVFSTSNYSMLQKMTTVRQLEIVKVPKVHLCRKDGLVFSLFSHEQ